MTIPSMDILNTPSDVLLDTGKFFLYARSRAEDYGSGRHAARHVFGRVRRLKSPERRDERCGTHSFFWS
jgi:hypothetical protein